jgi:hypothetical protein
MRKIVLFGIAIVISGCSASGSGSDSLSSAPTVAIPSNPDPIIITTSPALKDYTPKISDFKLVYKTKSKQCFDTAGCALEGTVDIKSLASNVPEDASLIITFTIKGATDETTDSIEVEDGKYDPVPVYFQTKNSRTKPEAVVTGVEKA